MGKPKFPMVVKRGHTTVKIYKTPSNCDRFTVVHYLGEKRQRKTFSDLMRGIKGLEANRGSPFSQPELDDAFERWYDWNRAHLKESKATCQAEFMGRYELAKYPLGSQQMLQDAWARVTTDALPPDVQAMPCDHTELKRMAAFCRELQRMAGPPPKSFSSPHVLKKLLGHREAVGADSRQDSEGFTRACFGGIQHSRVKAPNASGAWFRRRETE